VAVARPGGLEQSRQHMIDAGNARLKYIAGKIDEERNALVINAWEERETATSLEVSRLCARGAKHDLLGTFCRRASPLV
jgi:hypothetical protein